MSNWDNVLKNTRDLNDITSILRKLLAQSSTGTANSGDISQITVLPTGKGTTLNIPLIQSQTNITFTQANAPNFTLALTQGTGANKVVWPSSIKWQHGIAPVLSYQKGQIDILYFISFDQGITWLGSMVGGGYQ